MSVNGFYAPYRHLRITYGKMFHLRAWRQDTAQWMFWKSSGSPTMPGYDPLNLTMLPSASNLVAWWKLGEGDAYPTVRDSSGNGYDGTMVNMEITDFVGRTAPSNTLGKCITVDYHESIRLVAGNVLGFERTDAFSVSFWAANTVTGWRTILGKRTSSPYNGWSVMQNGSVAGTIQFELHSGTSGYLNVRTNTNYADGGWHHYVITYDGSSTAAGVTFYIDGQVAATTVGSDTLAGSILTSAPFKLLASGSSASSTFDYWHGYLDEAAIWDKELSPAEAAELYALPLDLDTVSFSANLLAWWKCGNGYSTPRSTADYLQGFLPDSGPNGYDLDCYQTDWANFTARSTVLALRGEGTNEYVTMGNILAFERTDAFSISCWFKGSTAGYLLSKITADPYTGYGLYLLASGSIRFFLANSVASNGIDIATTSTSWGAAWTHVVVTYDGSSTAAGTRIYVNGILQSVTVSQDTLSTSTVTTTPFNLLSRTNGTACLVGDLDNVGVYDVELTSEEVEAIYAAATAIKDTTVVHVDEIKVKA